MKEWITVDRICDKQFSEVSNGYNKGAVDDFLDTICDEIEHLQEYSTYLDDKMNNPDGKEIATPPIPVITTDEIMAKTFEICELGYEKEQVHAYFDEICETINHIKSENAHKRRDAVSANASQRHENDEAKNGSNTVEVLSKENETGLHETGDDSLNNAIVNKPNQNKAKKKKPFLWGIVAAVILAIVLIIVLNPPLPEDRMTFTSEADMKAKLVGKYYNYYSEFSHNLLSQITITDDAIISLHSDGDEYDIPIEEWKYKTGEISTGAHSTYKFSKNDTVVFGSSTYTRAYHKETKESFEEAKALRFETGNSVLKLSEIKLNSNSSYMVCTGRITNTGKKTYKFIRVKGAFKDDSGKVLDTEWTYAVGSEGLASGESSTFQLSVTKDRKIDNVTVTILGYD